jgi:MFS family permease
MLQVVLPAFQYYPSHHILQGIATLRSCRTIRPRGHTFKPQQMPTYSWKLKLTLLLVSSLTIMSVITISPALPEMTIVFGDVPDAQLLVKLVLTVPALMIALVSPFAGRLIDRFGRLKILWIALALYAFSGTAGFFLGNIYEILFSRAVLGIAVGISMTTVITLIADYFDGNDRQKFVGIQVAFMSLGGILFIGIGGILADISWRHPFLLYLFALAVLPLTIAFLKEPVRVNRANQPIPKLHPPRFIWLLFLNTMFMWILFFIIPVQLPFYLKTLGIDRNAMTGLAVGMSTAASAVSSFSYAKLRGHLNFVTVFAIGYLLMGAGFLCMAFSASYAMVIVAMILSGLGIGMMIPNTNMWVMTITPPPVRGREIGKLTTFWFMGQFLSPILIFPFVSSMPLSSVFFYAAVLLLTCSLIFFVTKFSSR